MEFVSDLKNVEVKRDWPDLAKKLAVGEIGTGSAFTQQELPACKPLLTPGWVITIYMVVGVIFIPIGVAALLASRSLNENEDLIVWMRTAALPTFRKLYGRIDQDLNARTQLSVQISNNYNMYSFNGKKKLVLSTTSWLGGKNDFLGVAYITIGTICIFLALAFFLLHWKHPRPLGDTSYLSWNRENNG
ncbi:hypothetical protein L7F22_022486 [Adiantum nelumboides]|nr:hypothetical protein [Adiantum nelumboides]